MMSDIVKRIRLHWPDMTFELAEEAADEIERLRAALEGIKWRSADRDNMEFAAAITYSQMDAIRAALAQEKSHDR